MTASSTRCPASCGARASTGRPRARRPSSRRCGPRCVPRRPICCVSIREASRVYPRVMRPIRSSLWIASLLTSLIASLIASTSALAKVTAPERFCAVYPESSTCVGRGTTCTVCHTSTSPAAPAWNAYGLHVLASINGNFDDPGVLENALRAVESSDDDGDGVTNLEEILLGTLPGDEHSFFKAPAPGKGATNPVYDVGQWDASFAFKRMM